MQHDGVCVTTVRRAAGVAKKEELAVKRTGKGPISDSGRSGIKAWRKWTVRVQKGGVLHPSCGFGEVQVQKGRVLHLSWGFRGVQVQKGRVLHLSWGFRRVQVQKGRVLHLS